MSQALKTVLSTSALMLTALSSAQTGISAQALATQPVLEYAEVVEAEAPATVPAPKVAQVPARPAPKVAAPVPAATAVTAPKVTPKAAVSATTSAPIAAATRATGRSMILKATAYNSLSNQTDSTPHITATGTRTRPGVVALSRDMLRIFPYGTRVTLQDMSGRYNFSGRVFVVEDTMHPRKTGQVDIWMPTYREAMNFGKGTVRITALR